MFTNLLKSMLGKAALAAVVLGGALCFAGAPNAQADEIGRIRYDNYRLHQAEVRHGFYSPAANHWRYERREAFARGYYDRFGYWHRY
ncbi:MAG TPA: hypothetical protein VKH15_14700 [Candidatus Acidoferrum sp.]|nr:hypothetical protein [Candidatus Acidoferrum sp.]